MNACLLAVALMGAVTYEAPAVVSRFLDSNAFVRVIHGPVGSSKSSGCVSEIMRRALEQEPHNGVRDTRFVVVRNTYRELEDTTRRTFEQWLGAFGSWREADFAFDIDRPLADGTRLKVEVLFRALDRPQDVKKLLSLELTGAYINELRELPKAILDGLTSRVGRYPSQKDGGPTWYGVWADTNPWAVGSEYDELFKNAPQGFELFRQPSGLSAEAENIENLPPGYYARMCAGKDTEWIDEYVKGENPKADKGSIYGALLAKLEPRIGEFPHPTDGVFATFDLGVSDATAIWFWRINKHGVPDFIDWYEATGRGASHYFAVLRGELPEGCDRERKYQIARVFVPHDVKAREWGPGVSPLQMFFKEYGEGRVTITPEFSVSQGIEASRWLLEQPIRFKESTCEEGIRRLRGYRYKWDEEKKVFSKTPVHDWTSHTADAFRYVAVVAKKTAELTKKPPPKATTLPAEAHITLDDLEHDSGPTARKRL